MVKMALMPPSWRKYSLILLGVCSSVVQCRSFHLANNFNRAVTHTVATTAANGNQQQQQQAPQSLSFRIERVCNEERVLDVLAFRAMSNRIGGCDAIDGSNNNDIKTFKSKVRKRIPESIQRFEVGGGKIIQFVALKMSPKQDDASSTSVEDEGEADGNNELVVGAVDARYYDNQNPRGQSHQLIPSARVHLKNLKVRHGYRRRGIGTALLNAIEQLAISKEASAVTLVVEKEKSTNAVRLYQNLGYIFQEEVEKGFMMKKL